MTVSDALDDAASTGMRDVSQSRVLSWKRDAAVLLFLALFVILAQVASGAYTSDLASDSDEPAHVVSSLLVRDYLVSGFPHNPLQFAKNYYIHYPKVAIGHWPPLFYAAEAVWMLLFGRTRAALLALNAAVALMLAFCVYIWTKRDCGRIAAGVSAAVLITMPAVRASTASVAPDLLLALLAYLATAAFGVFLERRGRRRALLFLLLSVCVVATSFRGVLIMLMPLLTTLTSNGETRGSGRRAVASASLAILCAGLVHLPHALGRAYAFSPDDVRRRAVAFWTEGLNLTGPVVFLIAAVGACSLLWDRSVSPRWKAMVAFVIGAWIFHALVNVPFGGRFLIPMLPAILSLFALGWHFIASRIRERYRSPSAAGGWRMTFGLVTASSFIVAANLVAAQPKRDFGYHRLVKDTSVPGAASEVYLVAGDPVHEGAFISEVALNDPGRRHIVLRATKVLSSSTWAGRNYRQRFESTNEVLAYLDEVQVGFLVLQDTETRADVMLLRQALENAPGSWQEQFVSNVPAGVRIFRHIGPPRRGPLHIELEMGIGQVFELNR